MKNLAQLMNTLSARKPEIMDRYHVKSMAVFGSYARNEQKKSSDVDILVEFNSPVGIEFIDLANYLEAILKIRVDLVSRKGVKPGYYKEIKRDLRYV